MNRSTKYVKNQELKRFNNIKGKKKYLLTSKVMNRMELSVPIILYLMFIGIGEYAYKLIRRLNAELESEGFVTIKGCVSTQYFIERIYGLSIDKEVG